MAGCQHCNALLSKCSCGTRHSRPVHIECPVLQVLQVLQQVHAVLQQGGQAALHAAGRQAPPRVQMQRGLPAALLAGAGTSAASASAPASASAAAAACSAAAAAAAAAAAGAWLRACCACSAAGALPLRPPPRVLLRGIGCSQLPPPALAPFGGGLRRGASRHAYYRLRWRWRSGGRPRLAPPSDSCVKLDRSGAATSSPCHRLAGRRRRRARASGREAVDLRLHMSPPIAAPR